MAKVGIIMGSKSDYDVVAPAINVLKDFGVETVVRILSAHRTPDAVHEFAENASSNGIEVIIAAAGKAAHLGGVVAAFTHLPVIGLPVKSSTMDGLDSLLSMVQMPAGIPVGCVAIQTLSVKYADLAEKMKQYKKNMADKVMADEEAFLSGLN